MAAKVGIRFEGEDYVSPTVKHIQGTIAGLGVEAKKSILTGVGLAGGVAAFSALSGAVRGAIGFMGDAVHAAIADEESVGRLTQSLKANVPAWDGDSRAIEANILSKQKLGFTDEELRASMALLVGATHDVGKAQLLQAAAMDLARFKGIDLATASDALLKVEGGRYRILASLGIQLGKNATQTEVLAAIQKVAAGQAEKFGESTAGATLAASIAFDEMKEGIGRQLLPAITALAKFARDVLIPNMGLIAIGAGSIASVFLVAVAPAIWAAVVAFGALAIAAAPWIAAAALVALAGIGIASAFDDKVGPAVGRGARALRDIKPVFIDTAAAIREGAATAGQAVVDMANRIQYDALGVVAKLPSLMADELLRGQQMLADAGAQLAQFIKDALSPAQVIARDQGFLTGQALADALASTNPLVAQKAREMRDAALVEIGSLAYPGAVAGGTAVGTGWIGAIVAAINAGRANMIQAVTGIRNIMGHSLPTEGPLKGDAAEKGGLAIGMAWAGAIGKGIKGVNLGLIMPSMGGGMGFGSALGGGGGFGGGGSFGSPVVIQLQVDGRTLAEIVDRQLYYQRPTAGLLGRG